MLQGKVINETFIVVDTFALPVEGTETRVNAAEGAYEYLTTYPETAKVSSVHLLHQPSGLLAIANVHTHNMYCRQWGGMKTSWGGTIHIQGMGAGYQGLTVKHR